MPSPFPGMDPYLERPSLWPDVHYSLIIALRDALAPIVAPKYYVAVEERVYLVETPQRQFVGKPDVAVVGRPEPRQATAALTLSPPAVEVLLPEPEEDKRQIYLEIRDPVDDEVITAIEVLSYTNKRPGENREEYEIKRRMLLATFTALIEIDLLRAHPPMPMTGSQASDYRLLVSRYEHRPRAALYPFSVREPIPVFPVPLRPGEPEPQVDLKPLLDGIYERASYARRVNYRQPPEPRLTESDAAWAEALLREKL